MAAPGESILEGISNTNYPGSPTTASSITACSKALVIPHVLKGIICSLPRHQVLQVKAVCKVWHTTCQSSKQIRLAAILHPSTTTLDIENQDLQEEMGSVCCIPYYPGEQLRLHLGLREMMNGAGLIGFAIVRGPSWRWQLRLLEPCREGFVTIPPCTAVGVEIAYASLPTDPRHEEVNDHCIVYRLTGVKIGDLIEVVEIWEK